MTDEPTLNEAQIRAALKMSRGSISVAANSLGVTRQWLHTLIRRYGIVIETVRTVK